MAGQAGDLAWRLASLDTCTIGRHWAPLRWTWSIRRENVFGHSSITSSFDLLVVWSRVSVAWLSSFCSVTLCYPSELLVAVSYVRLIPSHLVQVIARCVYAACFVHGVTPLNRSALEAGAAFER